MFANGEDLVKHWQFTGTHTGVFMGIPATGRTVNIEGCTIAKIVDGKIVEEWGLYNSKPIVDLINQK